MFLGLHSHDRHLILVFQGMDLISRDCGDSLVFNIDKNTPTFVSVMRDSQASDAIHVTKKNILETKKEKRPGN